MTTPAVPRAKRLYLINRDFQLRYTRIAVLVGLVSTVLTLFLVLYPLVQFRIIRFPNFVPVPFLWAIAVAAVVNFLIVATMGVVITHRIAGPMYALVRHFRVIQTGRTPPPLKVRPNDDLKFLVRNFNELLFYLRATAASDRERLDRIAAMVGDHPHAANLVRELSADFGQRVGLEPSAVEGSPLP